jgi:phosphoketolase
MQEAASERERADVLSRQELSSLDAYWRAANYLSVGQIYLLDNPLLREPLKPEHTKARQDHDVDFGMPEEPEQVLEQERISAAG